MFKATSPLHGVRVLNYGGIWAGRVASLLLAEQGAEVIDINRPGSELSLETSLLGRAKTSVEINLKSPEGRDAIRKLISGANIVIDNLGVNRAAKFGIDYAQILELNKHVVYVSMPGFSKGDPMEHVAAWEGTIGASTGLFTNIPALGKLLGVPPKFSSLPMASALAGTHAAIASTLAFYHRLNTGVGQRIEVSLADSVLSAMAIHAMEVEKNPARYDMPPIDKVMTEVAFPLIRSLSGQLNSDHMEVISDYLDRFRNPLVGNYKCADGKLLFIHATEHISQTRNFLQALGLLDKLISDGMVLASPYADSFNGNNLCDSASLAPRWRKRLADEIASLLRSKNSDQWEEILRAARVPVTIVRTTQEWLNQKSFREAGIVACVDDPNFGMTLQAGRFVSIEGSEIKSPTLISTKINEARHGWSSTAAPINHDKDHEDNIGILNGIRVLDLSNIIAGPVAGRVLAEFGSNVTRIEAPSPVAGPRMTMWFGIDTNQGKRSLILDLKTNEGKKILSDLIKEADVVLHNFLDETAMSLGLLHEQLSSINPNIISCQISAWSGASGGKYKNDPAWDPVLQAATGITARYGTLEQPVHHGNPSTVDFITGYSAACGIAQALVARRLGRGGSHVRTSLAMGAQLIQFPFMVQADSVSTSSEPSGQGVSGYGAHYRIYKSKNGWAFLACRIADLELVGNAFLAKNSSDAALAEAIISTDLEVLQRRLSCVEMASIVDVLTLERLRIENTSTNYPLSSDNKLKAPSKFARSHHPSGYVVTQLQPIWYRFEKTPVVKLTPAPLPGADTKTILQELGMGEQQISELLVKDVVRNSWPALKQYLPS